jgi:hypothetical protein
MVSLLAYLTTRGNSHINLAFLQITIHWGVEEFSRS